MQTSIRHADTKATALLTINGAVATAIVDRVLPLAVGGGEQFALSLAAILVTCFVIGLVTGSWQLVLALQPRLDGPSGPNRFGFPNLVRMGRPSVASPRRHRDEAWDLVTALARIAMAKHLRIRRSMPWFIVTMTSASALMIVTTLSMPATS
ncbi:hypothetical protein ACGF7U_20490 [Micromonospora sp. NPDC047670]|uniref:hypothetical protein n=1 Tax=Micromonospora sp. NPDC047670 TaxID=3364252 RepID=UPI0037105511